VAVHVAALLPLAALARSYWLGGLGPDPAGEAIRRTGRYAIVFLLLSLVPTAIKLIAGSRLLLSVRRTLGLYAFAYAALHLLGFAWLDYGLDLDLLLPALVEGRRTPVGLAALVILLGLAVTSTAGWKRRLGRNWKRLHRLTYLASALAVLHYVWSYKELRAAPFAAGLAVLLLLAVRVPPVAALLGRWRRRGERGADSTRPAAALGTQPRGSSGDP
jgi:sulfoxide reductase heme-binding subunit YedZ